MQFIDLHRQYDQIAGGVQKRWNKILEHKAFIGGPEVKELEEKLAEYVGVKYVIGCASGTDALTIPLMAYEINKSDAVFVPSFTFFASAESIKLAGGTPVFVDTDPETFNMDSVDLEKKIEHVVKEGNLNPKGIVAVDLFGMPANYNAIRKIAEKYGLFILEDAAQGFGGTYDGRKACSFGDIAGTSFFPAKPLGCYGDGGAIFTNDDDLAEKIRSIHVHGQGKDKYNNIRIGLNSRLDSIQAAVLLEKLSIFDEELAKRNEVAFQYSRRLTDYFEVPKVPNGYISSWAQYTLKAENSEHRDRVIYEMSKKNIPVMIYYPIPIHKAEAFSDIESWEMSNTEEISNKVFSIPMHPYLSDKEIGLICDALISTK